MGGLQASGRSAWRGISRTDPNAAAIAYGFDNNGSLPNVDGRSTRLGAVIATLRLKPRSESHVLVWHIDLLKLVPLIRRKAGLTMLFLHGIEAWRGSGPFRRRLLKSVDHFLVNSAYTWNRFVECHSASAGTAHSIVPLGFGSPAASAPPNRNALVMVSRLTRADAYKGHREIISAWPRVVRDAPDAELWIVGDGDLRAELQELAFRCGTIDRIRFLGSLSETDKTDAIAASRGLLMPSRAEGFGLVYLEAMRLGRPCLVSNCDAGREVVNPPECGIAVDPTDQHALVDAVRRLLAQGDEWQSWSVAARARYESLYTEAHFQDRLAGAIQSVMQP